MSLFESRWCSNCLGVCRPNESIGLLFELIFEDRSAYFLGVWLPLPPSILRLLGLKVINTFFAFEMGSFYGTSEIFYIILNIFCVKWFAM